MNAARIYVEVVDAETLHITTGRDDGQDIVLSSDFSWWFTPGSDGGPRYWFCVSDPEVDCATHTVGCFAHIQQLCAPGECVLRQCVKCGASTTLCRPRAAA